MYNFVQKLIGLIAYALDLCQFIILNLSLYDIVVKLLLYTESIINTSVSKYIILKTPDFDFKYSNYFGHYSDCYPKYFDYYFLNLYNQYWDKLVNYQYQ